MKIAILSDIHGNKTSFLECMRYLDINNISACILLGDLIDYGPHSNEVIEMIQSSQIPILCNIWGNHEQSIFHDDYERFSSERGRVSAKNTKSKLNENSWNYIQNSMINEGSYVFEVEGKKCLAIHGSVEDEYWKAIKPGSDLSEYEQYDYVFSGHSHVSHIFSEFYDSGNSVLRNKKRTTFVNPGSVGQPRNHNPRAQFVVWDTKTDEFKMCTLDYDIKEEQDAFSESIDRFYRDRLVKGV